MSIPGVPAAAHEAPSGRPGGPHEVRLVWHLARWEFRLITRGPAFWLAVLAAASGTVDLAVDGDFGPALVARRLGDWVLLVGPLVFLPALGALRRRDAACGIHELVQSRPVSALAAVAAKFLGGWAALTVTWLVSMTAGAAALGAVRPQVLPYWADVLRMSALLTLPCYAFVTGLALAMDGLTGRTGVVLATGALAVVGSWFLSGAVLRGQLAPVFQPPNFSAVFGLDPYTGLIALNRAWSLALTAGLLALALWLLPRKVPVLTTAAGRRVTALLLVFLLAGGAVSAVPLLRAPASVMWEDEAQEWEMAQVRAAAAGSTERKSYWVRHRVETPAGPVEVYLARGSDEAAVPLAQAAARLLPHFPALRPPAGEPLRIFEGSFLRQARLEQGHLVLLPKDVATARRGGEGRADRALLRAMAEAYWADLAQIPAYVPGVVQNGEYFEYLPGLTWDGAAALYHQWVVLERAAGPEALAEELRLWESQTRDALDRDPDAFTTLHSAGAVGYASSALSVENAFTLWAAGQSLGHDRVLAALEEAAAAVPPVSLGGPLGWIPSSDEYWQVVASRLGLEVGAFTPNWR